MKHQMGRRALRSVIAGAALAVAQVASAGTIFSATGASVILGGPGSSGLNVTYNQAGLNTAYTSGVTDFDTYVASAAHDTVYTGQEWFSQTGTTAATVVYDLGSEVGLDAVALWNEESAGIGTLALSFSTDNLNFFGTITGLTPTNNAVGSLYKADVFSFTGVSARYVRFAATGCPQGGYLTACGIGEVAFRSATVAPTSPVPEAPPALMAGVGLLGVLLARRRKTASR